MQIAKHIVHHIDIITTCTHISKFDIGSKCVSRLRVEGRNCTRLNLIYFDDIYF